MTTENTLALSGKKAVVAGGISGIGPKADRGLAVRDAVERTVEADKAALAVLVGITYLRHRTGLVISVHAGCDV